MKKHLPILWVIVLVLALPGSTFAQTTTLSSTFTYQGYLTNASGAVNGLCDMQFSLFNAAAAGTQIGSTLTKTSLSLNNGTFAAQLDFGASAFDGTDRYLQIAVRCPAGSGGYTTLAPRQPVTPAPYTLFAEKAPWNGLSSIPAGFADSTDNDVLATLSCTNGQISSWNGTNWVCAADSTGTDWGRTGNAGTTAGTNFIGTTDNQALEFRVNNLRVLRLEPNATSPNIIGGFNGNNVLNGVFGAFIGGGGEINKLNRVTDNYGVVSGGLNNRAGDDTGTVADAGFATVSGGYNNTASGNFSIVGGGYINTAAADTATVSGGYNNNVNAAHATVGGGQSNIASGDSAAVGGGSGNTASGFAATIPGGSNNVATGNYSFAAGYHAYASNDGTFTWADSTGANFGSNIDNIFLARASGGFYLYTNPGSTIGVGLPSGSGTWSQVSDRNMKANFVSVDPRAVLQAVANMPVSTWNYITQDASIRHIGPMAQDFYAAFGVGEDDTHISTIDSEGVALAAIQGLYQVVQDKDAQIADLQTKNADLQTRLDNIETRLAALESSGTAPVSGVSNHDTALLLIGLAVVGASWSFKRRDRKEVL